MNAHSVVQRPDLALHHATQNGLARMLFDPAFAEAVRADPAATGLQPGAVELLRAIDPRALRADPLRVRRTLGALCEELKASSTLALAETRSLAFVERFFASHAFHASIEERTPMALAFGRFFLDAHAAGRLRAAQLPDVVRFELMQARARREQATFTQRPDAPRIRLAPGCIFGRLATDVFEAVQAVEKFHFELQLLPQLALCDDGPRPRLPVRPGGAPIGTLALLAVPSGGGLSMVTLDDELAAVIEPLDGGRVLERAALGEIAARAIGRERAQAQIAELLDSEVLQGSAGEPA